MIIENMAKIKDKIKKYNKEVYVLSLQNLDNLNEEVELMFYKKNELIKFIMENKKLLEIKDEFVITISDEIFGDEYQDLIKKYNFNGKTFFYIKKTIHYKLDHIDFDKFSLIYRPTYYKVELTVEIITPEIKDEGKPYVPSKTQEKTLELLEDGNVLYDILDMNGKIIDGGITIREYEKKMLPSGYKKALHKMVDDINVYTKHVYIIDEINHNKEER